MTTCCLTNEWFSELRSGDVLLMDRNCLAMREPIGMAICLLNKVECRFDHVAMIMKLSEEVVRQHMQTGLFDSKDTFSPSNTYVLETNLNGVTLRSLENRLLRSSAKQMAIRQLNIGATRKECEVLMVNRLKTIKEHPYKASAAGFLPTLLGTPDKMDRVKAAHKLHLLSREIASIDELLPAEQLEKNGFVLRSLRQLYIDAYVFLSDMYFPHLGRLEGSDVPFLKWDNQHFAIDGSNEDEDIFCSELVARLWQESGVLTAFPPASSFRPFDFLYNVRFNFIHPSASFGDVFFFKKENVEDVFLQPETTTKKNIVECLEFYRQISGGVSFEKDGGLNSIRRWLIQSNTNKETRRDLPFDMLLTGFLFALCGLTVAPLRLRWIECQVGVMLRRGSIWSLASGFLARDVLAALTQSLAACVTLFCLTPLQSTSHTDILGPPLFNTMLFDTRHPYYLVCVVWFAANAVAHLATTPLLNAVLAHHFGPVLPGPLPPRLLMRGAVSLLPLGVLLPFQAAWVTWYETMGSALVPTPSSVLRRRCDLLDSDEWRHYRYKALSGAFAATAVADLVVYPLQSRCWRSFFVCLYWPARSPSYGRRLYAGYSFRFTGNVISMFTTAASLSFLGII